MRVVVLGGGYAGVVATTRLEDSVADDVDLILVDREPHHLIQHELHRAIRRPEFADRIQVPFQAVLSEARFRQGTVSSIDVDGQIVEFEDGSKLSYDAGVISLGTKPAYYGLPGVEAHSIPLNTAAEAAEIGRRLQGLLESGSGDIVVGGGGLAGIQAAGELAQAARDADVSDISVVLLEQEPTVAPRFGHRFQSAIVGALESLGVSVKTGTEVVEATAKRVELADEESLAADLFVWAGGIEGTRPLSGDRPRVRADLRLAGDTFVAGDAATVVDENGTVVTPSAQTAVREARVAANNVAKVVEAEQNDDSFRPRLDRYREETFAWVVSVGDGAVAKVGPQILTGQPAKALKSTVGIGYLGAAGAIDSAVSVMREEFGFASSSGRGFRSR